MSRRSHAASGLVFLVPESASAPPFDFEDGQYCEYCEIKSTFAVFKRTRNFIKNSKSQRLKTLNLNVDAEVN